MGADCVLFIGRTLLKPLLAYSIERAIPVIHQRNGKQAWTASVTPRVVIINAAEANTSGHRLCLSAKRLWPITYVLLLTGGKFYGSPLADNVLYMPVASPVLFGLLDAMMADKRPLQQREDLLTAGPFTLDTTQRLLTVHAAPGSKREHVLRPKEANLLGFFFQHPNEIIDRKTLMASVWQTDYLGDTRTLNVHIRALRMHLEADPSNPIHLQTVRGGGYRFTPRELDQHK